MKKFFKITLIVILVFSLLLVSGGLIAYASITKNAEIENSLLPQSNVNTVFYDNNGNSIEGTSGDVITYSELPKNLINALISLEDKRFYRHNGVDYVRTAGALVNNIKNGGFYEGGSTITQQLIKNTHLSQEKTINRKLNEIKLAKKLEKSYTKEEILEMYFNVVYFGNGMYGIKAAVKGIFNKSVSALSLPECATLVAVLKNPSKYSPLASIDKSTQRRNLVLSLMNEQGYISDKEKNDAINTETTIDRNATFSNTQSYMLSSAYEAAKILNVNVQTLMSYGYRVQTYLDVNNQQALTDVIGNPDYYLSNDNGVRGEGLGIIVDNSTAGISAFFANKKRNVYELSRPYGSTAKPLIVYAPAFEYNLITAATPVLDEKTDFSGYMPTNYNDVYYGWTDVRTAIKYSSNVVAVKTYNVLGNEKCIDFASKIGIKIANNDINATVALGNISDNNLINLTGGYTMLANGGEYIAPSFVKSITDTDGNILYDRNNDKTRVISADNAYIITDILTDTAQNGTAKGLKDIDFEVAAKTGTVGDEHGNTDAYSVGYTTEHTFLIWHGNSSGDVKNDLNVKETGGSYATRSLRDVLKKVYLSSPPSFTVPDGVSLECFDKYAYEKDKKILLTTPNTPADYIKTEFFSANNTPIEYSNYFDGFGVKNVNAEISDGIVKITFENAPYLYYDIYRVAHNKTKLIKSIKPNKSETENTYLDYTAPRRTYVKYYIKPYFYNQFGQKIIGNEFVTDYIYLSSFSFDFDF